MASPSECYGMVPVTVPDRVLGNGAFTSEVYMIETNAEKKVEQISPRPADDYQDEPASNGPQVVMFHSLEDDIRQVEGEQPKAGALVLRYSIILLITVIVFGALYAAIRLLE